MQRIPWIFLSIALILTLGIFLRTYQFHDWLRFTNDQARDATLVREVVEGKAAVPLLGPTMRKSGVSKNELFHLGPVYYYFQIASAKMLGTEPDTLAFPDLLFSLFTVPLFFLFLRGYFNRNIASVLTGLYTLSFFAILYSRFAWNPNAIPFFVLLFLLSLHRLLVHRERAHPLWAVALGLAIGVGIQLHALLLVLFPTVTFCVFVFSIRRRSLSWSRWLMVAGLVVLLNFGQIVSEVRTGFANTRIFFKFPVAVDLNNQGKVWENIGHVADCTLEANAYILSSLGKDECTFTFDKLKNDDRQSRFYRKHLTVWSWSGIGLLFLFSIYGYTTLGRNFWQETDRDKKFFLGIIILYVGLSVIAMFPLISANVKEFRYFSIVFFLPYLFLGFVSQSVFTPSSGTMARAAVIGVFVGLIATNAFSVYREAKPLVHLKASDDHLLVLGEAEAIAEYLHQAAGDTSQAYLIGGNAYVANFFKPLAYLGVKNRLTLIGAEGNGIPIAPSAPLFYIMQTTEEGSDMMPGSNIRGRSIIDHKTFGNITLYHLTN